MLRERPALTRVLLERHVIPPPTVVIWERDRGIGYELHPRCAEPWDLSFEPRQEIGQFVWSPPALDWLPRAYVPRYEWRAVEVERWSNVDWNAYALQPRRWGAGPSDLNVPGPPGVEGTDERRSVAAWIDLLRTRDDRD